MARSRPLSLQFQGPHGRSLAETRELGRFQLKSHDCSCEPVGVPLDPREEEMLKPTEISKMKGQKLECEPNSKLLVVNLNYIVYVMKEGQVRIINQNGKDMFKLSNTSKASIVDLALSGSGKDKQGTTVIALDSGGLVSLFNLEALPGATGEERAQKVELRFQPPDAPKRVLSHLTESDIFFTSHTSHIVAWKMETILKEPALHSVMPDVRMYSGESLKSSIGCLMHMPENAANPAMGRKHVLDLTLSGDGTLLLALAADCLCVFRLPAQLQDWCAGAQLIQILSYRPDALAERERLYSVRVLADMAGRQVDVPGRGRPGHSTGLAEVVILATSTRCTLFCYHMNTSAQDPVGRLAQIVRVGDIVGGVPMSARLDVNNTTRDTLTLAPEDQPVIFVFPLAKDWSGQGCPFPYLQRLHTGEGAHQLCTMTGKSFSSEGATLFTYRAYNFRREQDQVQASHVMVHELKRPTAVERQETLKSEPEAAVQDFGLDASAAAAAPGDAPEAEPTQSRQEDVGEQEPSVIPEASMSAPRPEEVGDRDWGFVKAVAASVVKGLDSRKGSLAKQIITEVSEAVKSISSGGSPADLQILEQAVQKVREARQAQESNERTMVVHVKKAADIWSDQSIAAMSQLLSRELSKLTDNIGVQLATQLSQSRRFCDTLARGVQKSGNLATKQALEGLRPSKQMQDTMGNALAQALQECLGPVLKAELRTHFEQELVPLIGTRILDMFGAFKSKMAGCIEEIAAEQEKAAKLLGTQLGPIVQQELKQAERILQERRAVSNGGGLSEQQVEEMLQTVLDEVITPLEQKIVALSREVQDLRRQAEGVEQRWHSMPHGSGATASTRTLESERAEAEEIKRMMNSGHVTAGVKKAAKAQREARHVDFLEAAFGEIEEFSDWMGEKAGELDVQVQLELLNLLVKQLKESTWSPEHRKQKVEWLDGMIGVLETEELQEVSLLEELYKGVDEILSLEPEPEILKVLKKNRAILQRKVAAKKARASQAPLEA